MYKYVIYKGNNSYLIRNSIELRGNWTEVPESDNEDLQVHFIWKPTSLSVRVISIKAYNKLDELSARGFGPMIHNHLENHRLITTKPGLIRSLRQFYQTHEPAIHANYNVYDSTPTTFIITAQCDDLEYHSLMSRYKELENNCSPKERIPAKHCQKNMWLVKPAALNQGRGIEICHNIKEVKVILGSKLPNTLWVVQKYIERPLLFYGRKFDIRMWAIATGKNEFFYYRHGYLRTSSSEYDTSAKDNYIHLTNNCLQKYGDQYGMHEKGNTLSFQSFQAFLDKEFPELKIDFWQHILPRMKDLMIDSFMSAKKHIRKGKRKQIFELLGFDFLIDEDFRVWLIEVNTNPYLGIPNEYIADLLPKMIDDMLAITVDIYVSPKNPRARSDNDFELLYCEVPSSFSPDGTSKNFRQPFTTPLYAIPELAQVPMGKFCPYIQEEESSPGENQKVKIMKDPLQQVKEILDISMVIELGDFASVLGRIVSNLQNWEIISEELLQNSLQALALIASSNAVNAIGTYGHIPSILQLCFSDNLPLNVQAGIIESMAVASIDTKFRKQMFKNGISALLLTKIMVPNLNETLFKAKLGLLLQISKHGTKNIYIPGETREHDWMRNRVLNEGLLIGLYILKNRSQDDVRELIERHINEEFMLNDWKLQLNILQEFLLNGNEIKEAEVRLSPRASSSPIKKIKPNVPELTKKGTIAESNKMFHIVQPLFPDSLNDKQRLNHISKEISSILDEKTSEINRKKEEERQKKQKDMEEKSKIQALEEKLYEERRQRAEEELIKRYEESKKKRIQDIQRLKIEKEQEIKREEERRQEFIQLMKRKEETRKQERLRRKMEEEEARKQEEEERRVNEERRRKAVDEWLKIKHEKERDKKMREMKKREEEEMKRIEEMKQRREEVLQKLETKKKMRKVELKKEKIKMRESELSLYDTSFKLSLKLSPKLSPRHESHSVKPFNNQTIDYIKSKSSIASVPPIKHVSRVSQSLSISYGPRYYSQNTPTQAIFQTGTIPPLAPVLPSYSGTPSTLITKSNIKAIKKEKKKRVLSDFDYSIYKVYGVLGKKKENVRSMSKDMSKESDLDPAYVEQQMRADILN
jgi:hypothetical protein